MTEPAELPTAELSTELWNNHADWWQEEFTVVVDPEYTEQIIPLVVDGLPGVRGFWMRHRRRADRSSVGRSWKLCDRC